MKYRVIRDIHYGWETNAKKGDILTVGIWSNGEDPEEPVLMKDDEAVCAAKGYYQRECCELIEE